MNLVKILNQLINKGYKANLVFLGDGPTIKDVISYTKQLNLENFIKKAKLLLLYVFLLAALLNGYLHVSSVIY